MRMPLKLYFTRAINPGGKPISSFKILKRRFQSFACNFVFAVLSTWGIFKREKKKASMSTAILKKKL